MITQDCISQLFRRVTLAQLGALDVPDRFAIMLKSWNVPPGRPAQWCGAHKGPGMVDVANRRCEHDNCHKVRPVVQSLE